ASMLSAGISLVRSLGIMMQNDLKPSVLKVYKKLYRQIQQGVLLSEAMEKMGDTFPELMIQMYRAGEASGSLEKVANKLSSHYTKEHKMHSKIKSATTYPIILLCLTVVIMLIIFTFVLPNFFDMFDSFDAELPFITVAVMAISHFLTENFVIVGFLLAIFVIIIITLVKMPSVRYQIDKFKVHMPKIGKLMKVIYTARFARTLSSMYSSGLSMLRALDVSSGTIGNTYIAEQFSTVASKVRNGAPLSVAIAEIDGFDPKLVSTIFIGEESGRLDEMLDSIADNFDYESEQATEKMITFI
ncbi:MAG: type II secretion system F family protein, partial [Oscillospiraceae bacterium]